MTAADGKDTRMRPNIVLFLPDQLRADFLGCYGADWLRTPAIDELARSGVRYTDAVSSSPLCVPARTALLTGMHPLRTGVLHNEQALRPDYPEQGIATWADRLAEDGYTTASIGKMHFYPWDAHHGFNHRVVAEDKRHTWIKDDYHHYLRRRGQHKRHGNEMEGYQENRGATRNPVPLEDSIDTWVGREACAFLRDQANEPEPFALVIGFPGPHCPYDPDDEAVASIDAARLPAAVEPDDPTAPIRLEMAREGYRQPWADLELADFPETARERVRRHYSALIARIDAQVGAVMSVLRKTGLDENTIVVLASDHGDFVGDRGMLGKAMFYESCIHVPLIIRTPDRASAGSTSDAQVDLYDLAPTMLRLAGVSVPPTMDARVVPIPGALAAPERTHVVGALADGWMWRDDRWTLHRYVTGERLLFDRLADPDQINDLSDDPGHREILDALDASLVAEVMTFVAEGHADKIVATRSAGFDREGWRRPYPHPAGGHTDPPLPQTPTSELIESDPRDDPRLDEVRA